MKNSTQRIGAFAVITLFWLSTALPAAAGNATSRGSNPTKSGSRAVTALSATARTIAGPGLFLTDNSGRGLVYEVVTGSTPDVCITVSNVGQAEIRVVASNSPEGSKFKSETTRGQCFAAPDRIELICDGGHRCEAAWRIDMQ